MRGAHERTNKREQLLSRSPEQPVHHLHLKKRNRVHKHTNTKHVHLRTQHKASIATTAVAYLQLMLETHIPHHTSDTRQNTNLELGNATNANAPAGRYHHHWRFQPLSPGPSSKPTTSRRMLLVASAIRSMNSDSSTAHGVVVPRREAGHAVPAWRCRWQWRSGGDAGIHTGHATHALRSRVHVGEPRFHAPGIGGVDHVCGGVEGTRGSWKGRLTRWALEHRALTGQQRSSTMERVQRSRARAVWPCT